MKELFRFTKGERIASLILLILTLLGIGLLFWIKRDRVVSPGNFRRFDSLVRTVVPEKDILQETPDSSENKIFPVNIHKEKEQDVSLSTRDPNKMTKTDWQQLDLSRHLIRTIIHYREAGGKFRKKEDLKKIYGMSDSCYNRIAGFLEVPLLWNHTEDTVTSSERRKINRVSQDIYFAYPQQKLEINQADSVDFSRLHGISPKMALRIIRYRTLLGGYVKKNQLLEVYGLNEKTFLNIKDHIEIDTSLIRKINVNRCMEKTLAGHPYLSPYEAKAIVFYRSQYKYIDSLDVLLKNNVIPVETFRKIRPYLQVQEK
ncbi:MAG TPA: hypothetical protein ENK25_03540 [Bacteroidetes bacterium]|nr:hypothetical protein [Bacteroidota bacterium]